MAFYQRKRGYVYVFTYKDGRQRALPRAKTKHLDAESDANVQYWVDQWSRQYEHKKVQRENIVLSDDTLSVQVEAYGRFLEGRRKSENTISWHLSYLRKHVIPFFLEGENPLRDPQQWPGKSIKFLAWMQEHGETEATIIRANIALKSFYAFLSDEGVIQTGLALRIRRPVVEKKETPLKYQLGPDSVLEFASRCTDDSLKLMALLGYFCSLRPNEVFGLTKADFRAGSSVQLLDCSKAMTKADLYPKLAINVTQQRVNSGEIRPPKVHSKGWVCCFNETAARAVVKILEKYKHEKPLFDFGNSHYFRLWAEKGIGDITLKDLRRASLYWLGHHTSLQLMELMKHARHARVETTLLYLRRPEEALVAGLELDLDA